MVMRALHRVICRSDELTGLTGKKEGKARLMNLVMQLRKGETIYLTT
jgi:hypothetical protein